MLAFRFIFVYFALYLPPTVTWLLPGGAVIEGAYNVVAYPTVTWAATHVFGLQQPITLFNDGSDRTYNFFQILIISIIAAAACSLWSIIGGRRSHPALYRRMRVVVRYALALIMLSYGYSKMLGIQFEVPQLDRLLEPYGQSTPMGLLWTFMGSSPAYNVFTGAIEVVGAVLLLWERTTLLGSLILVGVLSNVVMLNFAYDVQVKLFSLHLLAFALFLTAPHLSRLVAALTATAPSSKGRSLLVAKAVVVCLVLWVPTIQFRGISTSVDPLSPQYGIWEVDTFVEDGASRQLQFGDSNVWRRLIVNKNGSLSVQTFDDAVVQWRTTRVDDSIFELAGTKYPRDPRRQATLRYEELEGYHLVIDGTYDGRLVHATLHRVAVPRFELLSHPFHWVNEYHHNR